MDQPVEICLSERIEPLKHRALQLYTNPAFHLPNLGDFEVQPFPESQPPKTEQQAEFLPTTTYAFTYNPDYERIIGAKECYPLSLCLGGKYIAVACKSQVIVFEMPDFATYTRIPMADLVTAMDVQGENLALGCRSGRIIYYSMLKKAIVTEINYYSSFILRIKWVSNNRICAIDSLGSFVFFDFNIKTIMDKSIVTSIDNTPIYEDNRERTRDKVKRIWKSFVSKEEKQVQPEKHSHTNFSLIYRNYDKFVDPNEILCAVFRKNTVKVAVLTKEKLAIKSEQQLFEGQDIEQVGVFTLGVGGFDVSNHTYLLLVVSVQSTINYFKYVKVDDLSEWHHVFTMEMNTFVYSGSFISNNLLIYLTDNGIQLGNVGEPTSLVTPIDLAKFGYIDFFNSEENMNINKKVVYKNILKSQWAENIFACIEGKRLILGTIESWQSYLNIYTNECKWEEAMIYALQIYKGTLKKLAGINQNIEIRKEEMMSFFEKITITYLTFELKRQPQTHKQTLRRAINFMLDTENFSHLFTTVYQATIALGFKDLFFQVLEQPILKGKVKVVPVNALIECIKTYKNRGNHQLLETLIMNLQLDKVDRLVLLETCLRFQMFRSLIHICVSQDDYVTPIIKLCGLISLEPVLKQGQAQIGDILFWYIKGCLQGIFIECYELQKYISMLQKLVTYVFVPVTLKILCKIDIDRFFVLINKFFEPRILQLILENSQRFIIKRNPNMQQDVFDRQNSSEFEIYERMLKNVIFTEYFSPEKAQPALQRFIVYLVLKNQFHFNETFKTRAVMHFITHPLIFSENPEVEPVNEADINAYLMRLFDSSLSKCSRPTDLCESYISKIYNVDQSNLFAEALCYLYHQLGKFSKCFELYLKMKNYEMRERILLYLEQNIDIPELQKEILNNIISLVKISEDKALKLLATYLPHDCEEIINKLASFPKYQLKYLELVFQSQHALTDELKIIHLGIVIKYEKHDVESFLRRMDYPLDEAYRICEQAGHKPAMAYLAFKKGMILEGALILADVFCEVSDEVVRAIAKKQVPDPANLYNRLKQMLSMCSQEYAVDQAQGETVWFRCLEKIFKHIKIENLVKQNVPIQIRDLLNEIVTIILNEMCSQVNVEFFVAKFTKNFSSLPFNVFSKAYLLMKERLKYTERVFNLTKALFEISHLDQNIVIIQYYQRGLESRNHCAKCNLILEGMSVVYQCGHSLHFDCCGQYRCAVCRRDIEQFFNSNSKVLSCDKEIVVVDKHATATEKLKAFDVKLEQISSHLQG